MASTSSWSPLTLIEFLPPQACCPESCSIPTASVFLEVTFILIGDDFLFMVRPTSSVGPSERSRFSFLGTRSASPLLCLSATPQLMGLCRRAETLQLKAASGFLFRNAPSIDCEMALYRIEINMSTFFPLLDAAEIIFSPSSRSLHAHKFSLCPYAPVS